MLKAALAIVFVFSLSIGFAFLIYLFTINTDKSEAKPKAVQPASAPTSIGNKDTVRYFNVTFMEYYGEDSWRVSSFRSTGTMQSEAYFKSVADTVNKDKRGHGDIVILSVDEMSKSDYLIYTSGWNQFEFDVSGVESFDALSVSPNYLIVAGKK